jgi:hypothetical protein
MQWWTNNELEGMWKEAAVAYFRDFPTFAMKDWKKHEKPIHDNQSPGRDLKPGLPEYGAGMLTTRRRRSVFPFCSDRF